MPEQPTNGEYHRDGRIITFYSYKGGTGRTMALANTAWILASNGYRVLTVDWDLEAPGLHRFFHPFLDPDAINDTTGVIDLIAEYREEALRNVTRPPEWYREYARVRPHAVSLAWHEFPRAGCLDFLSAGRNNTDYSATLGSINWDRFYDELGGGQFFAAMREDMRRHYDFTLIDSRTGLSDVAEICTVEMPDEVVVCFTLSSQSIDGASTIAQRIQHRYGDRGIRILPVPMRVDEGEKEKVDAGRALAKVRFDGLPRGLRGEELDRYWGSVEIPYRPFYAYEEILAPFGDQPGVPTSMLSACERLTGVLTRGRVSGMPAMDPTLRMRYVDAFTRRLPVVPADIFLSYMPEDRMWADWLEHVLTWAGFRVLPRDVSAGADPRSEAGLGVDAAYRTIAVLSPSFAGSPQARTLWEAVAATDPSGALRQLVPVRVGELRIGAPFNTRNAVDLVRREEREAIAVLLRALGRDPSREDYGPLPSNGPRFPGTRPRIWNVRLRNPSFTGRSALLEKLRSQLGGGTTVVLPTPQTLYGLGGVGKTQVALEYAHRFMADYDLVWWVEAEQPEQVALSLAELAQRLKIKVGDSVSEAAEQAREALRRGITVDGVPIKRWLLIFDNADDPAQIARWFPGGGGHILITSRNQAWSGHAESLEVDVFTRAESIEHLCRAVPKLRNRDANRVAEAIGDLPLAVSIAAAWLETTGTPVDTYVAQLQEEAVKALALAQPSPDYPMAFGATWHVSIARLSEQSPASAHLLKLCAFMSPEPISMNLFYSDQTIAALLPYDPELRDKFMLGRVIQAIGRYGLAKIDVGSNTLQVHRMVQAVIRAEVTRDEEQELLHEVHRILVSARPKVGDTDDPENWSTFREIWPHLTPSRAVDCDEPDTRQLLIDRVRYLWKRGDLEAAESLGRQLDEAWTAKLGDEDRQTLLLRFQLANVLRTRGQYQAALELDQATLETQRRVLPPGHVYGLMTAGSLAADLRTLGRYQEALELDVITHRQFWDQFGLEHPRTLSIANNLAIDYRFVGDYVNAEETDQAVYDQRTAVLGRHHPYTLDSKLGLAHDKRGNGDYRAAVQLLEELQHEWAQVPAADLPESLRTSKSLALTLRRLGRLSEARALSRATYDRYLELYGEDAPDALACALVLAADEAAFGDLARARELAAKVHRQLVDQLGEAHPYSLAAANNLAIYLRSDGSPEEALAVAERTVRELERALGDDHPLTLCAVINLANTVADSGDPHRAERLERRALEGLSGRYRPQHPDALTAAANLAVTLQGLGRRDEAHQLRGRTLAEIVNQLGEDHPMAQSCRSWSRISRDLELEAW